MPPNRSPRRNALQTILVALLLLTGPQLALAHASETPSATITPASGHVGDRIQVEGDGIPGGYMAYAYWDRIQPWDGGEGVLNASKAEPSGHYMIQIKVPASTAGVHFIWVGNPTTGDYTEAPFEVKPGIDPPDPYVVGNEELPIQGRGFGESTDVAFMLYTAEAPISSWPATSRQQTTTYLATVKGSLSHSPIKPGSLQITCEAEFMSDDGRGALSGASGGSGTINYVTGEYTAHFAQAHTTGSTVQVSYGHFDSGAGGLLVSGRTAAASGKGAFSAKLRFEDAPYGSHALAAMDSMNNTQIVGLLICRPITVSRSSVDVGDVVSVRGSGFTPGTSITADLVDGSTEYPCGVVSGGDVEGGGEFQLSLYIPQVPEAGEYNLRVSASDGATSLRPVQVNALTRLSSTLQTRGDEHTVVLRGVNYPNIQGHPVTITLVDAFDPSVTLNIGTATTSYQGEVSTSFTFRAAGGLDYRIVVSTQDGAISAESSFQVSILKVEISSNQGAPEKKVTIRGGRFTPSSHWNATLGDVTLITSSAGTTTSKGALRMGSTYPYFRVPDMEPGEHRLVVTDVATGQRYSTTFTVLPVEDQGTLDTVYPVPKLEHRESPSEGEPVSFDASGSHDPDGAVIYYLLDFGDGSTSNSNKALHTYTQDGAYKVRLTVRDNRGAESVLEETIDVEDLDPAALFSASRTSGYTPLTVAFVDESMSYDGIGSWLWDFGDGTTSTEKAPHHTYTREGVYAVALKVRESDGDEAEYALKDCVRVLGDDRQPPTFSTIRYVWAGGEGTLESVVADNSDIKAVTLHHPLFGAIPMEDDPTLPGLYRAHVPTLTQEVSVTMSTEDYNGNRAEAGYMIRGVADALQTRLDIQAGWSQFTVPGYVATMELTDLCSAVASASQFMEAYHEANGLTDDFQAFRVVSVWAYDEYRGYLFYDASTGQGDLDHMEGGRSYWISVEGATFYGTPLEAYVVYS